MRSSDTGFDLSFDHPGESEPVSASDAASSLRLHLSGTDLHVTHIAITDGVLHLSLEATLTEKMLAQAVTVRMPSASETGTAAAAPSVPEEPRLDMDDTGTPQDSAPVPEAEDSPTPGTNDLSETSLPASSPEPVAEEEEPAPEESAEEGAESAEGEESTFFLTDEDLDADALPDLPEDSDNPDESGAPGASEQPDALVDQDRPLARGAQDNAVETVEMGQEEFLGEPSTDSPEMESEEDADRSAAETPPPPPSVSRKEVGDDIPMGQDASDLLLENDFRDVPPPEAGDTEGSHGSPVPNDIEWATSLEESSVMEEFESEKDGDEPAPAGEGKEAAPSSSDAPPAPLADTPISERPRAALPEMEHRAPPPPPLKAVDGDDIFSKAIPKSAPPPPAPKTPEPSETMTFHASSGRSGMTGTFQSKPVERMDAPKPPKPPAPPKPKNETSGLVKYICPRCKTPGMAVVDKVGQIVTCDECGKALRLTLKK